MRVMKVLGKRLGRFGLRLSADKTRLVAFQRPRRTQESGKGAGTFEFLGFTHYWRRSRKGVWHPAWKTRKKSLNKAVTNIWAWCKDNRHLPIPEQHAALTCRLRGHFQYFGVNGNLRSLVALKYKTERAWLRWLRRRGQRTRMTWERFRELKRAFPFPKVKVYANLWAAS